MTTDKLLMNPATGSVDTEDNWKAEMFGWDEDPSECQRQFDSLVEVHIDEEGQYVESE